MQTLLAGLILIFVFPLAVQLLLLVVSNPLIAIVGGGVGLYALAR